jgi:hypothetical protein
VSTDVKRVVLLRTSVGVNLLDSLPDQDHGEQDELQEGLGNPLNILLGGGRSQPDQMRTAHAQARKADQGEECKEIGTRHGAHAPTNLDGDPAVERAEGMDLMDADRSLLQDGLGPSEQIRIQRQAWATRRVVLERA